MLLLLSVVNGCVPWRPEDYCLDDAARSLCALVCAVLLTAVAAPKDFTVYV